MISGRLAMLTLAGTLVGLAGCARDGQDQFVNPVVSAPASAINSPWYDSGQSKAMDRVARVLASAMTVPAAAQAMHAALRESLWSEHKVTLRDFLSSAGGRLVLSAGADRTGMPAYEIERLIAGLPSVDLYVPFVEQRRSWQAGEPIAVAALVDTVSPVGAYLSDGARVPIDRWASVAPSTPILLLGPAEVKVRRPTSAARFASGMVIEEADEEIQSNPAQCYEDCGGGGGGGTGASGPLRVSVISTVHVCDNGFCGEGNEFEFRATANGVKQSPVMRCTSIPSSATVQLATWPYCNTTVAHSVAPPTAPYVDVDVVETDGISPDDKFRDYVTPVGGYFSSVPRIVDNASHQRSFLLYKFDTGLGCYPPNPGGSLSCDNVQVSFVW